VSELTLIIGNKNYSSWSLRPWMFMRHHQLDFKETRIPLYMESTREALSKYHSDFKVPVLLDGELEVWDSLAILEYLSENYVDGGGWPHTARARAVARSVSAEMHSSFVAIRTELTMDCRERFHDVRLSPRTAHDVERVKALWRYCRQTFGGDGEWLFGDFSIADAMFAPVALRFDGYGIPVDGVEKAYVENVLKQSCIIEWMEAGRAEKEIITWEPVSVNNGSD